MRRRVELSGRDASVPEESLSNLIGAIYDCALAPQRWPVTMVAMGNALSCTAAMLQITDLDPARVRLLETWNFDAEWLSRLPSYAVELAGAWRQAPADKRRKALEGPISVRRELPGYMASRYVREMISPLGIVDSIHFFLGGNSSFFAELAFSRHSSVGLVTDGDLELAKLLFPHVCRAVTINGLIAAKEAERHALMSTLDKVAAGIVIVGNDSAILHANESARKMLEAGSPIYSSCGRLSALDPVITNQLHEAISSADEECLPIGGNRHGVPLVSRELAVAAAYVLPIASGELRARLSGEASAAVFVVPVTPLHPADLETVSHIFRLTRTETRHLQELLAGSTLCEAASKLGVSVATARTHREHIFSKLDVSRRSELVNLVRSLVAPTLPPG